MRWQLTLLGMLLCLLAALFAVEAKVAWFGPDGSPSTQISATKLQAADAPKVASQANEPTFPGSWIPQLTLVLALALIGRRWNVLPQRPSSFTLSGSPGFTPSLFFRPPPVR